jgi:hypothetical protein
VRYTRGSFLSKSCLHHFTSGISLQRRHIGLQVEDRSCTKFDKRAKVTGELEESCIITPSSLVGVHGKLPSSDRFFFVPILVSPTCYPSLTKTKVKVFRCSTRWHPIWIRVLVSRFHGNYPIYPGVYLWIYSRMSIYPRMWLIKHLVITATWSNQLCIIAFHNKTNGITLQHEVLEHKNA